MIYLISLLIFFAYSVQASVLNSTLIGRSPRATLACITCIELIDTTRKTNYTQRVYENGQLVTKSILRNANIGSCLLNGVKTCHAPDGLVYVKLKYETEGCTEIEAKTDWYSVNSTS
jgi:hypothetical protein